MKVSNLVFANLAGSLSNAYNKMPKSDGLNRFKITHFWDFDQINLILQTKAIEWCHIIWASHPRNILSNFKNYFLAAIWPSTLQAEERNVPMLAEKMDLVHP